MPEVCDINPARPRNLPYSDETLSSFVPMAAVDDQQGKISDLQTRPFGEIKSGYTYFEENDVLFAKITPCMENGKSAIARGLINGFGFGSTEFHVLRPHHGFLPEWIYYFVRREPFRQEAKTNFRGAVGQQRVPQEFLRNYLIPVPYPDDPEKSLAAQTRIILRIETVYHELTEARRLYEKIVADTNRLMDAVLAEVYPTSVEKLPEGWHLLPFPGVCSVNPTRPRNLVNSDETKTSFVPMAAVNEQEGRITDLKARPFGEVKRGYTYFEENDVLFAKITPCMENGKAAVARGLINGFGFGSTEFHVLRPTNSIHPEWIYYFIRRETFRQEAKTKFRGAVGQQRVPQDFLETHLIPVPFPQNPEKSLDVQQQIITRVQTTAGEVAEAQLGNTKTGALLNQMEQSILAQAFRGEL